MHYGFFCLLSLLSAVVNCGPLDQGDGNICLVIGSSQITIGKLKSDIEFISSGIEIPAQQRERIRSELIEQCINHYLILEYGKEHGIILSKNELQNSLKDIRKEYTDAAFDEALVRGYVDIEKWKTHLKEQLLVNKILDNVAEGISKPNYQEIKSYYEKNEDEFRSPKMIEFRQIVTRTREEANNLLKRLRNGESMNELAKRHSIAPEAEDGGRVGWVAAGHLIESMENVLFTLPQGQISPVVETPYGFHIFEVLSVRPAGLKELPDVIEEIQSKLTFQQREIFIKKWIQDLRNHFEVKINQNLLNTLEFS